MICIHWLCVCESQTKIYTIVVRRGNRCWAGRQTELLTLNGLKIAQNVISCHFTGCRPGCCFRFRCFRARCQAFIQFATYLLMFTVEYGDWAHPIVRCTCTYRDRGGWRPRIQWFIVASLRARHRFEHRLLQVNCEEQVNFCRFRKSILCVTDTCSHFSLYFFWSPPTESPMTWTYSDVIQHVRCVPYPVHIVNVFAHPFHIFIHSRAHRNTTNILWAISILH